MAAAPMAMTLKGGHGHTAGIFASMSVDGPVIGTLVAVVDRAKNLPNRKTIGKQDPFCAARLGKEAKKTKTDIRGGQTPKWDQELRFTVHDSPDYYQLKVSVFTDDKKTDLIGEAWIDLKAIIVAGGGQSDVWQGLTCRGKYAGEVRLEITFYDSRPRPERRVPNKMQSSVKSQDSSTSKQRKAVKRRPLPSDPVTGESPAAPQDQVHTPRSHASSASQSHPAYVPTQSPRQSGEYTHTPPQGARPQREREPYTPSPQSAQRHGHRAARESYGTSSRHQDERGHDERSNASSYDQRDPRGSLESFSDISDSPDDRLVPASFENGAPPPPPAHGSRQQITGPDAGHHYNMRQDVSKSRAHRHSMSSYPGQPVFKPYDPSVSASMQIATRPTSSYESLPSQHMSRSPGYSPIGSSQHRSMQPTVEDDPDSPNPKSHMQNDLCSAASQQELDRHTGAGTSSQIVSRSPGAYGQYHSRQSPLYESRQHPDDTAHPSSVPPSSTRTTDYSNASSQMQISHSSTSSQHVQPYQPREARPSGYVPPAVPLSLSPGVDLALSRELCNPYHVDQRHEERYSAAGHPATPTRGRRHSEQPPPYNISPQAYTPQSYDGRSVVAYSGRSAQQATRLRTSPSPNPSPQHAVRRKSLSPAPPSAEDRRLSDPPFDPDSFNAFNPNLPAPDCAEMVESKGKVIGHDGREIDPTDYLPMDTWAPEPEPRGTAEQVSPESPVKESYAGAKPMPASGRRTLRIAARPSSMPAQQGPCAVPAYGQTDLTRTSPISTRHRLQKKATRASTGHSGPSASMSSPLAPISPDNYQERQMQYTPTRSPRLRGSLDYSNENRAPHYGSGPPIPTKVPLAITSGAHDGADMTLMEEMQRIDIGAGRSRRRGGY
ncbi:hypothetical protein E4U42_000973 [Claviceps africana]|uniref:C2 domain-containing protein n=1 Tax=Claviceps africana TaxID=83212 RepID=A0A8K0NN22_9HYPO|nr:hypothetical protein E4U42_000973 [Claviceps africana]